MDPISAIFARLGGPARVAEIIGKSTEHAATMRRRRSIPVWYWAAVVEATPIEGHPPVTHGDLIEAHAHRDSIAARAADKPTPAAPSEASAA